MNSNAEQEIVDQVSKAAADKSPLKITGGNSKLFYGRMPQGDALDIGRHSGIVSYEPTELVITARAGTSIHDLQHLLAQNNQMLGFEPTLCSKDSTLGGVVAAGLAGPARAYAGSVRDFVLGVRIINGGAEVLNFGGQVMKNVAGFDHSRLMTGSLGTLGVLLEVSLRVLPAPKFVTTIQIQHADPDEAITFMNQLSARPYPISAAAWLAGRTRIRLSGTEEGVISAIKHIGADSHDQSDEFFSLLNIHQLDFFRNKNVLYRLSVPSTCRNFCDTEDQLIDWGGAQRWIVNVDDQESFRDRAKANGATLTVFRGGDRQAEVFDRLDSVSMRLHQNIKLAFDPKRIFNPGRMYKDL